MQLVDYFEGVAVKRLSRADANLNVSNQHEINTTQEMRNNFLGAEHRKEFKTIYLWLGERLEGITYEDSTRHYDTRHGDPNRGPEWRLYYTSNPVTKAMKAGDTLFLAKDLDGSLLFVVTPAQSTCERQLFRLFGLEPNGESFVSREFNGNNQELDFVSSSILEGLGIEIRSPEADDLDEIVNQFGGTFPSTTEFSRLARSTLPNVQADVDPDGALMAWIEKEEALFFCLERRIVATRLERGFTTENGTDIDGFIKFSLSVQNRRKSRRGYSLENHIAAILEAHELQFARGAIVENNHRPDFLFPSLEAYEAATDDHELTVLGAKSSCKERWRQVLAEADKIRCKHLLTLEPSISVQQTQQMRNANVQLVVPQAIQESYSPEQQEWLWSVNRFLEELNRKIHCGQAVT